MPRFSVKRNAEGYFDQTPYYALFYNESEEKEMSSRLTANPKEIWRTSTGKYYLIVKDAGFYYNVLTLSEEQKSHELTKGFWTNPGMLSYFMKISFNDMTYCKTIEDDEFTKVIKQMAKELDLEEPTKEDEDNDLEDFTLYKTELQKQLEAERASVKIYKELYFNLLQRMIK